MSKFLFPTHVLMWNRFEGDTSAYTSSKVSMQTIPDSLRSLVYSQQLSRYLKVNLKLAAHLQLPAVLLRTMARANKIESSSIGYLSPSMLLLFVLRYDQELYEKTLRGDYDSAYMDHFSFAKNICRHFGVRLPTCVISTEIKKSVEMQGRGQSGDQ
jgi:hypothetical protein